MRDERERVRQAYVEKAAAEIASLVARGVRCGGYAFSEVLLVKAENEERPFSGADGDALRASLDRLGYPPECWEWLVAPRDPALMREAVVTLDPATVILCDEDSARIFCDAFACGIVEREVARVRGMRVLCVGNFARGLADRRTKQLMWAALKQLPPLGDPY